MYKRFLTKFKIVELERMRKSGFTIVEMIVVVAIISILASLVIFNVRSARLKARDTTRVHDLEQIEAALQSYKLTNGKYPKTGDAGDGAFWYVSCDGNGVVGTDYTHPADSIISLADGAWGAVCSRRSNGEWITGLTGLVQPKDPINASRADCSNNKPCLVYMYGSDGQDYKLMAWEMESNSGINLAKKDHGASTDSSGSDYCQASRYDVDLLCYINDCESNDCPNPRINNPGSCGRNGFGPDEATNYELYSPGGRCW